MAFVLPVGRPRIGPRIGPRGVRSRLPGPALLSALSLCISAATAVAAVPIVVPGRLGDQFQSAGIDAAGVIVVAGIRAGERGFFELADGQLTFTSLNPAAGRASAIEDATEPVARPAAIAPAGSEFDPVKRVSRNGRFVAAMSGTGQPLLWDRGARSAIPVPAERSWIALSGVGLIEGQPALVGVTLDPVTRNLTPTVWRAAEGFEALPDPWTTIAAMTDDGRLAGLGQRWGEPKALLGTATDFQTFNEQGNDAISIYAVSPNGRMSAGALGPFSVAGGEFVRGVLWSGLEPRLLFLPSDQPVQRISCVTDGGFAGGPDGVANRGYIHDPRDGRVRWFDEWWIRNYPDAAPVSDVWDVADLVETPDRLVGVLRGPQARIVLAPLTTGRPASNVGEAGARDAAALQATAAVNEMDGDRAVARSGQGRLAGAAAAGTPSIARIWNEELLNAIRIDLPHPPVHARNLFHFSIAVYDAWAAYDPAATGCIYYDKHEAGDRASARQEAISYAAYRILRERYALSRAAATTLQALEARMAALGYSPGNVTLDPRTPAGVGNRVAAAVSAFAIGDGARQAEGYTDILRFEGGYAPLNPPQLTAVPGVILWDVNRWQPLAVTDAVSQNGIPVESIQNFLGRQWANVRPFALHRTVPGTPWIDPGPPPHLGGAGDAAFRVEVIAVIQHGSELSAEDGVRIDISPGALGNNPLGSNGGTGHSFNPATGRIYEPNVVRRGDFTRVLAEYWADGPSSETPPGHWNVLANLVSEHPSLSKRIGGTGPVVDELEWDVKLYLAMNAALHDAACAAWTLKRHYDGWRPFSAIRLMGQRGQSSDPAEIRFHPYGLPLVPGLIELVTSESARTGGRHEGLSAGTVAVRAWRGQPRDPTFQVGGVGWIAAVDWVPYQKKSFVTPAFPGYVSGHSTFSRAAAEVLAAFTGSAFFPGGLASFTARSNRFLTFEKGPTTDIRLEWATYFDAADQAGRSRLWGGIHPPVDDLTGRRIGAEVGRQAWALARRYFDGSVLEGPTDLTIARTEGDNCRIQFGTAPGLYYKLQVSADVQGPFTDLSPGYQRAEQGAVVVIDPMRGPTRFFRVATARSAGP